MKSWLLAILLHVGLLGFFIVWPQYSKIQSLPKDTGGIPAFLAGASSQPPYPSTNNQMLKPGLVNGSTKLSANNKFIGVNQAVSQHIAPQNMQVLLNSLDRDIQAHLTYPDSAQSDIQQGFIILAFDLQPDGQISNIAIEKSSGMQDLDQAAIQAVQQSSPISMAIQLNRTIHLSLPVNFSLE
ncbi:MAG: Gram-negative bacterial TonB protein C-terminal [Gammaproteobacteria bacterium]|jgi:TonB family protein|nr:Gram-negative bacterial TonB protein C-terminal [Gammaproteobacteria bacterium]